MSIDKTAKKADVFSQIQALSEDFPQLAEIDPEEMTKQEMIDRAEAIMNTSDEEAELTDEAKLDAIDKIIEKRPEAVIVPARQAIYRLLHPEVPGQKFEVSVYGDQVMGSTLVPLEQIKRRWRTPEGRPARPPMSIHGTPLKDVPSWARLQVYDLIDSGDLRLFTDLKEAQSVADPKTMQKNILDVATGEIGMQLVYAENTGLNTEHRPIIVEPRGNFKQPEQQAAWKVLNEMVDGESPLPPNWDYVDEDPRHLHPTEVAHVITRIKKCLDNPERFTDRPVRGGFDERAFFNQLLECEYKGFTPRRTVAGSKNGGTRPQILKEIRRIAEQHGFEVLGDYVRSKQEKKIKEDILPTVPFDRKTPLTW